MKMNSHRVLNVKCVSYFHKSYFFMKNLSVSYFRTKMLFQNVIKLFCLAYRMSSEEEISVVSEQSVDALEPIAQAMFESEPEEEDFEAEEPEEDSDEAPEPDLVDELMDKKHRVGG